MNRAGRSLLALSAALLLALAALPALHAEPPAPSASARLAPSGSDHSHPRERLRERARQWLEQHRALPSAWPLPSALASTSAGLADAPRELARRWAELASSREERRVRHRAALVGQLGARLQDPAVRAELATHGKRLAELNRLQFLAANARSGEARDKLLARIQKLQSRELSRHQRALAKLTASPPPAPSASGAAP
jgi:hypothetical protein